MLTPESHAKLAERAARGHKMAELSWGGGSLYLDRENEDFDSACKDAISDILTARFGPAGKLVDDPSRPNSVKVGLSMTAVENASDMTVAALESYFGDAEDYIEEESKPEPGQYGYEEPDPAELGTYTQLRDFLDSYTNDDGVIQGDPAAIAAEAAAAGFVQKDDDYARQTS